MKKRRLGFSNKKGQLTIFIIIGIAIVAISVLLYFFLPQIGISFGTQTDNPSEYMQTCLQDEIQNATQTISLSGGSLDPENYILYNDDRIEYLCYTEENYAPCVMQRPLLKQHIESEIENSIEGNARECFDALVEDFENQGFDVSATSGDFIVELLPGRVVATLNNELTITKDSSQRFEKLDVVLNNNLYELTSIATSILNWEARYGDAETTTYMTYYRDLRVEKKVQGDGSTIYILTDRDTGNKFQFASRSVAFPAGI